MVEAGIKVQAERRNALANQFAQQQTALQNQRDTALSTIQKEFSELPDEAKQFPAIQHELKRQQILADMDFDRNITSLRAYGQPGEVLNGGLKMVDEKYKRFEQDLKPIEETKFYDTSRQNWTKIQDSNKRINTVIEGINASRKLLDSGDERAALDNLKTNVIKPMSNMESNDAVGVGDALFKYTDLLSAPEVSQFQGKSAFNPTSYAVKLLSAKSREEKDGVKKDLMDEITSLFEANPKAFLKTAITGANFHVDAYNKSLKEQVINTTSPGVARRMGAVPMEYIAPLEDANQQQQANRLATPNPFGQSISSGGTVTPPSAMPQQQSQQANPLNAPLRGSTIFRIKQ